MDWTTIFFAALGGWTLLRIIGSERMSRLIVIENEKAEAAKAAEKQKVPQLLEVNEIDRFSAPR